MKIILTLLLALSTGCSTFPIRPITNFYEVDEGKLYRSRQLNKDQFKDKIKEYNIKTIVNLRGASPSKDWYQDEKAVAARYGVEHVDINMSARRLPHRRDLVKLLDTFRDAPKPILIHCQGGADRTGLASAVYGMVYMGQDREDALKSLSVRYGHLEFRHPNKKFFVRELWQGEDWARSIYDPCASDQNYGDYYDQTKYCAEL